jgi:glycosyltransferase involved in cell wall biosynthesis
MIRVSVIVPTLNRAKFLADCLKSLADQDFSANDFEVLVVDNGSTDDTAVLSEQDMRDFGIANLRKLLEPAPGLLSGRHRGALEAKGELLFFVDDDIEAAPGWLAALASAFDAPRVHLAGGPCIGKFDVTPPSWFHHFQRHDSWGDSCPALSLIHMGAERRFVEPYFVWGLNYAIRRQTLFDLGGFHPDGLPSHLLQYRGDGETGLSFKLAAQELLCMYEPKALVHHCIPASRLTLDAFCKRFFLQGISDSYSAIRRQGTVPTPPTHAELAARSLAGHHGPNHSEPELLRIHQSYADGYLFHNAAVADSPALLEWVLRRDYFDYKLPPLEAEVQP